MKQLPVINSGEIERAELRARIEMSNRPALAVEATRLNEVAVMLAANNTDRSRFMANPAAFLNEQAVPVSSCNLVEAEESSQEPLPTVTLFQDCVMMVLLNCFADSGVRQLVVTRGVDQPLQASATATRDAVL
jgi:hypothetical protein